MKLYVVGGCQAIPLASALAVMNPNHVVERLLPAVAPGTVGSGDDVVFRQRNRRTVWNPEQRGSNELLYPRIHFNAFHPDLVYVAGPSGPVPPPMGDYHSSLALYGWSRGLSVAETRALFCEAVFERARFFDCWSAAQRALFEEGRAVGFPLEAMFAQWERTGCFMYSVNHPALHVIADVARSLMQQAGLAAAVENPESYLHDPMLDKAVWPIYPEVGRRLGLRGGYAFKIAQPPGASAPVLLELDEFIERSFEAYAQMPPSALACSRLEHPAYRDLEDVARGSRAPRSAPAPPAGAPAQRAARKPSPYTDLPAEQFWRRAVENVRAPEVDPVGTSPFTIDRRMRIATAGSCFAQTMSRTLRRFGYNYFVAEPAPAELSEGDARRAGYGVFSTRCGNVYTARQLLQLFERAYGTFEPAEGVWLRPDGRYADPFRPLIEPDGFESAAAMLSARAGHLAAVRRMFEQLDVFIFTLGLTEAWRSSSDGAVFPLAPGVAAGSIDFARYEFVNFTAAQVRDDLDAFLVRLRGVNPAARVVITVSPQPPIATYEPRHVLVSATYTKAALRVAADEIVRRHATVWYFPGYELVANAFNRGAYFERDLRTVTPEGVEHVMRLFLAHGSAEALAPDTSDEQLVEENLAAMDAVCDEEALAADGAAGENWAEYARFLELGRLDDLPPTSGAPEIAGTMEPLARASMRASIDATLPAAIAARGVVTVDCTVTNAGDTVLRTVGKHPVYLCYRWFDERGDAAEVGHSIHTPLASALEPGASLAQPMRITAPRHAGRYRLRVALLQSEVAWFDDVDAANGLAAEVDVRAERAAFTPS